MNEKKDIYPLYVGSYISCMKMNGVPLLPPLMTPEYRQEMQYYKQLAVAVERRINDLKFCLDETTINSNILQSDSEEWPDGANISIVSSRSDQINDLSDCGNFDLLKPAHSENNNDFESMNSQLTVIVNNDADIRTSSPIAKDLNGSFSEMDISNVRIDNKERTIVIQLDTNSNISGKLTKSNDANHNQENLNVAKNVIRTASTKPTNSDSSSSKFIKKIATSKTSTVKDKKFVPNTNRKDSKSTPANNRKSSLLINSKDVINLKKLPNSNKNKLSPSKNVTGSLNNISSGLSSPPKLVRQKSYTLEYPSPLLLAHLEVQSLASGVEVQSISMSESTSTGHLSNVKEKSLDSNTAKEIWSSLGSDMNSLSFNETSGILSTNDKKQHGFEIACEKQLKNVSNQIVSNILPKVSSAFDDKNKLLAEKEASPQSSSITSNTSDISQITSSLPMDLSKCSDSTSASVCLKYILKKFEEDHTKKMVELIRKQKEEQAHLQKLFENQQKMLLAQFQTAYKKNTGENVTDDKSSLTETGGNNISKPISDVQSNSESVSYPKTDEDDVDRYLKITDNILQKSRNLRNQKSSVESSPNKIIHGVHKSETKPNDELIKTPINKNPAKSEDVKEKHSVYDVDDNAYTERSANTLDDINTTFTSDDTSEGKYSSLSNSNISVRDVDGASKLKSALEKITKIQQNLASQPPIRFSPNASHHRDDTDSHQSISLSSISVMSNSYTELENHYSLPDRNALSLNLIDISRPQTNKVHLKFADATEKEIRAATIIVAYAKGFLARRLMKTEKVETIVQTIKDTLLCAIQLHKDEKGIQGADIDLHRRLIQQITAACYELHDTFIVYSPEERMRIISQDRERKRALMQRSTSSISSGRHLSSTTQKILKRKLEGMSKSHSGVFPNRTNRYPSNVMTRSHYDAGDHFRAALNYRPKRSITVTGEHGGSRRPWR